MNGIRSYMNETKLLTNQDSMSIASQQDLYRCITMAKILYISICAEVITAKILQNYKKLDSIRVTAERPLS